MQHAGKHPRFDNYTRVVGIQEFRQENDWQIQPTAIWGHAQKVCNVRIGN